MSRSYLRWASPTPSYDEAVFLRLKPMARPRGDVWLIAGKTALIMNGSGRPPGVRPTATTRFRGGDAPGKLENIYLPANDFARIALICAILRQSPHDAAGAQEAYRHRSPRRGRETGCPSRNEGCCSSMAGKAHAGHFRLTRSEWWCHDRARYGLQPGHRMPCSS